MLVGFPDDAFSLPSISTAEIASNLSDTCGASITYIQATDLPPENRGAYYESEYRHPYATFVTGIKKEEGEKNPEKAKISFSDYQDMTKNDVLMLMIERMCEYFKPKRKTRYVLVERAPVEWVVIPSEGKLLLYWRGTLVERKD